MTPTEALAECYCRCGEQGEVARIKHANVVMLDLRWLGFAIVPIEPDDAAIDRVAEALYTLNPYRESGEYIDGFQVSPCGDLTWQQVKKLDAEFADTLPSITETAYMDARAAYAAMTKETP